MGFFKTSLLLAAMTALFMAVGFMLGGQAGLMIAFLFALGMNFFAYWNSDKLVLKMFGATEISRNSANSANAAQQNYYRIVERLAQKADLPVPRVYILDNPQPNAFATGRNPQHAAVAASRGLLEILNDQEIAGVMAHELAHVKHRDTLTMTVTATLAGAIGMLANFALFFGGNRNNPLGIIGSLLVMLLAPMAAMLVQMAVSRSREYEADRMGAGICGNPLWLASALEKLTQAGKRVRNDAAEKNPAMAHLFIINPLQGEKMDSLFSTHPNMQNRIRRLNEMTLAHATGQSHSGSYSQTGHESRQKDWSRYGSADRYRSDGEARNKGRSSVPNSGPVKRKDPRKSGPWG